MKNERLEWGEDEVRVIKEIDVNEFVEWRENVKKGIVRLNKSEMKYFYSTLKKLVRYREKFKSVVSTKDLDYVYWLFYTKLVCKGSL